MAPITALLFDADDTLWDFQVAQVAVTAAVLEAAATEEPRLAGLTAERVIAIRKAIGRTAIQDDVIGLRRQTFRAALAEVGIEDEGLVVDLTNRFLEGLTRDLPLYPDTIEVLDWCGARYRLGLVSNGTKGPEAAGIAHYFETTVLAPVEGFSKPDPRLFRLAVDRMDVDPAHAVVIGDNDAIDVAGAVAAGMRSVLVDRQGTGSTRADGVVRSLGEVPAVLASLAG